MTVLSGLRLITLASIFWLAHACNQGGKEEHVKKARAGTAQDAKAAKSDCEPAAESEDKNDSHPHEANGEKAEAHTHLRAGDAGCPCPATPTAQLSGSPVHGDGHESGGEPSHEDHESKTGTDTTKKTEAEHKSHDASPSDSTTTAPCQ